MEQPIQIQSISITRSSFDRSHYIIICLALLFISSLTNFAQTITKGPFLVEPGKTEMIIRWESKTKINGSINYGIDKTIPMKKDATLRGIKESGFLYEVSLKNLKPGSRYFYQVNSEFEKSPIDSFYTYKSKQKNIHFVAMGDSRSNPDIFTNIINNMQIDEPDLIISMGDLVEYGGNFSEWKEYYFDITKNVIDHIPLVSTLGDHEGDDDEGELVRHFFRKDEPTKKLWFSFDYGDAHFVSLDYRYPESEEMINWFINDMSNSNARWNFIFFHRPSYNLGGHRSSWGRNIWPALFSKFKVDIVFAGHSHLYERFYPMQSHKESVSWPITYITTGGAGADLYEMTQNSSLAAAESVNHFVDIDVSGDTLRLKAIRNDGSILDKLTFIKDGESYDAEYLSEVKSQERINLLTNMISAISPRLEYIPIEDYAAPCIITLISSADEDVPFRIELAHDSTNSYKMLPISGILKAKAEQKVTLKILRNSKFTTISQWGEINPELKLKLIYTYDNIEETVIGGRAEYLPAIY